jgi:L-fuculokinase
VLNYPQYWGYRLTGRTGAEGTYTGCHSYFWDWKAGSYSSVVDRLGLAGMLPFPLRDSWDVLGRIKGELAGRCGLSPDVIVTMGIHDSNASLLPHLAKRKGSDFIVNSTGTWCVLMHPQDKFAFAPDELGKVVFFNRSAYNKPVKTAIFLGGMEYEAWTKAIAAVCGGPPREPGPELYRSVLASGREFILPELVPGSGQFPGSLPRAVQDGRVWPLADIVSGVSAPPFMRDGSRALASLNISLALQTLVALERAGRTAGTEVFTEGGFRKNEGYNALLASALCGGAAGTASCVFLTDISEATALGAAMTAAAALEGCKPDELAERFEVEYKEVGPMKGLDTPEGSGELERYRAAWLALVANNGGRV